MIKAKAWEGIAVDLVYRDKDPVTVAVLPRDHPDISGWLTKNITPPKIGEHCFVYTYECIIH